MLKVVHGNQSDNHCNRSDTQMSIPQLYIYDLVPKGVHENRTKEVENKVDDTLKLVAFLECAQC